MEKPKTKQTSNPEAALEDASPFTSEGPAPREQGAHPSHTFQLREPGTPEVLGDSDASLDVGDSLSPAPAGLEGEPLVSPSTPNTSALIDNATECLQGLKVKRPNLSRSQRKEALLAKLQERGEAWDPAKWSRKKNRKRKGRESIGPGGEAVGPGGKPDAGGRGAKRPRGEKATPLSAEGPPPKRHRGAAPGSGDSQPPKISYRDSAAIKMAIALEGYPESKLTEEQGEAVELAIISKIRPFEDGSAPSFAGTYMEKGALILSCLNESTKSWLEDIIPNMKPLGEELPIKVGPRKDILRSTRVFFRAHPKILQVGSERILEMLHNQNPALRVKEWRILPSKPDPKGYGFVCFLDEVCFNSVKSANFRANLGLWQVTFAASAPKDEAKGPSSQPPTQ